MMDLSDHYLNNCSVTAGSKGIVSYAKCEVCYTYKREVSYINDYLENAAY
jgi:hypothetical protein